MIQRIEALKKVHAHQKLVLLVMDKETYTLSLNNQFYKKVHAPKYDRFFNLEELKRIEHLERNLKA